MLIFKLTFDNRCEWIRTIDLVVMSHARYQYCATQRGEISLFIDSGKDELNTRPNALQATALPTELSPVNTL